MSLAPNVKNYLFGKGRLYFKSQGESGFLDFGNVPKFELNVEVETVEHFSSRSGTRQKDLTIVTEKKATAGFDLEEYSSENLNLAFLGDGVQASSQIAGTLDAVEVTLASNLHVEMGKNDVSVLKIEHGTVTGGPFEVGEQITGGTSSATGDVAWVDTDFIELINVSGTFQVGETLTGGTSSATASSTSADVQSDVVVTDAAVPTLRYVQGTDYDLDIKGGLIRKLSGGSIGSTAFVSADYPAISESFIRGLANSKTDGEMLFIGDPDQGPVMRVQMWNVNLTIGGAAGFISDDITPIPMSADILADTAGHPSEPFFRLTQVNA